MVDAPAVPTQHWKPGSFPGEWLLLNLCGKAKGAGGRWQQMLEQQHALWKEGLAAGSSWPSSGFPTGPPGQGKVPSTSKLHSQSTALHVNPPWNTLTDRDEFHQTSTPLNPVTLMPGPTITQEGWARERCWDFSYHPSHFGFMAAVRCDIYFTMCTHCDDLLCHRPEGDEAKWPRAETSNATRHQLSFGLLCPSGRNLTSNWHFIYSSLKWPAVIRDANLREIIFFFPN